MDDSYIKYERESLIEKLLFGNKMFLSLLDAVRSYKEEELWIGGGFLRTIVWDYLKQYENRTEFMDIDVFYYNPNCYLVKSEDTKIEEYLRSVIQNTRWSVKNQARMHIHNKEKQYTSLHDALMRFPETVSTIAVRLDERNKVNILAPYGYEDLFKFQIRPTPFFLNDPLKMNRYKQRVIEKKWYNLWTDVKYENIDSDDIKVLEQHM